MNNCIVYGDLKGISTSHETERIATEYELMVIFGGLYYLIEDEYEDYQKSLYHKKLIIGTHGKKRKTIENVIDWRTTKEFLVIARDKKIRIYDRNLTKI